MIKLNEDKEIVDFIRKKLKENKDKYGEQFCPCVIPTKYESENKEDYICMCKEFREQTLSTILIFLFSYLCSSFKI